MAPYQAEAPYGGQIPPRGDRHNTGKPKLSLVFDAPVALRQAAEVLEQGIEEYGRCNWKKGLPLTEIIDSLLRHTLAFQNGENLDPKSGKPHTAHIMCNALFLAQLAETRPDCDDRERSDARATGIKS